MLFFIKCYFREFPEMTYRRCYTTVTSGFWTLVRKPFSPFRGQKWFIMGLKFQVLMQWLEFLHWDLWFDLLFNKLASKSTFYQNGSKLCCHSWNGGDSVKLINLYPFSPSRNPGGWWAETCQIETSHSPRWTSHHRERTPEVGYS